MNTTKFYLQFPKKELSPVICTIYSGRKRKSNSIDKVLCFSLKTLQTGKPLKLPPSVWDKENQCPLKSSKIPKKFESYTAQIDAISERISLIKGSIPKIMWDCEKNGVDPTNELLLKELDCKLRGKAVEKEAPITVVDYYQETIKSMKNGHITITKSGKQYTKGTIDSHISTAKVIQLFEEKRKSKSLFGDINSVWYNAFVSFLRTEKKCKTNTIGGHIKYLKYISGKAVEEKITTNTDYKSFSKPKNPVDSCYLSEDELKKIYDLQVDNEREQKVKDLFLVGAYTGLRISDFTTLTKDNFVDINGKKRIEKVTKKTNEKVIIPLLWAELKDIVAKYNYSLPQFKDPKLFI